MYTDEYHLSEWDCLMGKISIIRGDDYSMPITIKNADWTAYNLHGCTLYFTVKEKTKIKTETDDTYLIAKDITQHTDEWLGMTTLILTNEETSIKAGVYVYDFQLKTVGLEIHSSMRWEFEVKEDVTKRTI